MIVTETAFFINAAAAPEKNDLTGIFFVDNTVSLHSYNKKSAIRTLWDIIIPYLRSFDLKKPIGISRQDGSELPVEHYSTKNL